MAHRSRLVVGVQVLRQRLEVDPDRPGQRGADLTDTAVELADLGVQLQAIARDQAHGLQHVVTGAQLQGQLGSGLRRHAGPLQNIDRGRAV